MSLLVGAGRSRNSGNNPQSGEIPTLQQVTDKGNATNNKIAHAPGETSAESATVGQVESRTGSITIADINSAWN